MILKIGISGAGIGGLAIAALLHDRGHKVEIFDQFEAPEPVGSGLVVQPVGLSVLNAIGVGDEALSLGAKMVRMQGLEVRSQKRVLDVSYNLIDEKTFGLGIHRSSLFDILLAAVKKRGILITTGFEVMSKRDGKFICADGRESNAFDLLIDASGANSNLSPINSKSLSYGAIWGTVDWPQTDLPKDWLSQRYLRAENMIGIMPCGKFSKTDKKKAAIFWSLPADGYEVWRNKGLDAWKKEAIALWPEFEPFVSQISNIDQMTFAKYSHGTLSKPWDTDIAYIGDAAHRASPQLGQGANMALLDAMALAQALDDIEAKKEIEKALRQYAKSRKWHVNIYQLMSFLFTSQYQSNSRILPWLRDNILFPLSMVPPIPSILTRLVCGYLVEPIGGGWK